jgi:spoIIIJ-associated protein
MTDTENTTNEADLAADYIEELLDIADLDGDIELGEKNGRPYVSVVSEDKDALEPIVGEDGEVLLALQYLARLSVGEQNESPASLLLDINGWRDKRIEQLQQIAQEAIDKVKGREDQIDLDSMNAFERKTIHDYVGENGGFSHSEGFGKGRHIVITATEVKNSDESDAEVDNDSENASENEE